MGQIIYREYIVFRGSNISCSLANGQNHKMVGIITGEMGMWAKWKQASWEQAESECSWIGNRQSRNVYGMETGELGVGNVGM